MSIFKKKPVVITLEDVCAIIRDEIRFHKHDRLQFEVYALEAKVKELTEQIESNIAQIHVQQQWLEIRGDKVKELETQLAEAREEIEPQEKALTHYISEFGLTKEAYEGWKEWNKILAGMAGRKQGKPHQGMEYEQTHSIQG